MYKGNLALGPLCPGLLTLRVRLCVVVRKGFGPHEPCVQQGPKRTLESQVGSLAWIHAHMAHMVLQNKLSLWTFSAPGLLCAYPP